MNNWIDVSCPITADFPVWPGDPKPQLNWVTRIKNGEGINLSNIEMSLHTGTHIDAPLHFFENGKAIDEISLDFLIGEVQVIQVPEDVSVINRDFLNTIDFDIPERVFFRTNNSINHYLHDEHFIMDYVAVDSSGASWLVDQGVKVVGIDYLSIASFRDSNEPHKILLGANVIVVEGLDLRYVSEGKYRYVCLPIKIIGREAAPARVLLESLNN